MYGRRGRSGTVGAKSSTTTSFPRWQAGHVGQGGCGWVSSVGSGLIGRRFAGLRRHSQQFAALIEALLPLTIGQKSVVADADETLG